MNSSKQPFAVDTIIIPNKKSRKLKIVKEVYLKCYHHLETKKVMMCGDREDN